MISKSISGKTRQKWEVIPQQLSLEEALKILNPDNRDYIDKKRGAYKRILIELNKGGQNEKN